MNRMSVTDLENEWPKIKILCTNCHRLETSAENTLLLKNTAGARKQRAQTAIARCFVRSEKRHRGACVDCGLLVTDNNYCVFDFDHKNREDKVACISAMINGHAPLERIRLEMAKCDLKCARCHMISSMKLKHWIPIRPSYAKLFERMIQLDHLPLSIIPTVCEFIAK